MPYVDNEGVRLYYETHGDGPPLALIMGLGGTVQSWALQLPDFARHYRVIAMDNRGAGRSDKPEGPYSTELFARDLRAVLDDAGADSAHLLGVSMGGLTAQDFYHMAPERVRSLVLGCTGVGANDPAAIPTDQEVIDALSLDRSDTDLRTVMEAMNRVFYHPDFRAKVPDLTDRVMKLVQADPQPPHAFEAQLNAALSHQPNSPRLDDIRVPTLVIHGADDRVWPLDNARYLAEHIPGARLVVIPGAGHMFTIEKPREFNTAVLEFLQDVDERG